MSYSNFLFIFKNSLGVLGNIVLYSLKIRMIQKITVNVAVQIFVG